MDSLKDCYSIKHDYQSSKEILKISLKHSCWLLIDAAICISLFYFLPIMSAIISGCSIVPILMQIPSWIIQSPFSFMIVSMFAGFSMLESSSALAISAFLFMIYPILIQFLPCIFDWLDSFQSEDFDKVKINSGTSKLSYDEDFHEECFISFVKIGILWLKQAVLLVPMPVIFLLRAIHCTLCLTLQTGRQAASCSASSARRFFNAAASAISSSVSTSVPRQAACS